jgi:hypothetical protein
MKTWKKKLAVGLLAFSLGTFIGVKQVFPTVSDTDTQTITANGNGVTVNYTIGFTFLDNDDVRVYLEATNVTPHTRTLLTYGTGASQYTITGGDPGTTVHMITAPTTNQRLVILRDTPLTQAVDYIETEAFPAADHEEAMDKLTLQTQELDFKVDTKIGLAAGSTATVPTFPDPPAANGFLTYSSAGVVSTTATTGVVSAIGGLLAANNLSDLTSVSTALANLGISSTNSLPVLGSNGEVLTIAGGALDYAQITNTNVAAAAAIDYSKLNLTGAVLNGDLAGSIADGKLATSYIKADGTRALTGNWNVGAFNITASSFIGSLSGNATTATSLAANPAACPGGQFVTDTAADGTLTCSTPAGAGDVVGPSASVDSEFAIYNSTTGKLLKRASGTGIAMGTSGVASFLSGATAGQVPMANGTTFVATTLTQPYTHFNCGLGASISGNTVVIDLKQSDGSTAPSRLPPASSDSGARPPRAERCSRCPSPLPIRVTVGASASLGHTSMTGANIYVYLIQDTTSEICVSNSPFLAMTACTRRWRRPSTGGGVLYCTNTHTSRPTHLLGVVKATYSAPNWSAITSVSIAPFAGFDESAMGFLRKLAGHAYLRHGGETLLIDTEEQDDFNAFFGNTYTVQIPSICTSSINAAFGSMDGVTDISITNTVCGSGRQCFGSRTHVQWRRIPDCG